MHAAHPPSRWNGLSIAAGIAAGAAAFASGFLLGGRDEPRASERPGVDTVRVVEREPDSDLTPLRDELRRLREEVERLAGAQHERVPIASADSSAELAALRRAVEALADSGRAPRARSESLTSMKVPMTELIARLS